MRVQCLESKLSFLEKIWQNFKNMYKLHRFTASFMTYENWSMYGQFKIAQKHQKYNFQFFKMAKIEIWQILGSLNPWKLNFVPAKLVDFEIFTFLRRTIYICITVPKLHLILTRNTIRLRTISTLAMIVSWALLTNFLTA